MTVQGLTDFREVNVSSVLFSLPPPPLKKMPDHRLNLNLVARVLSYPPFRARERGLDRVGRREPWEQRWLNLKSI